MTPNSVNNAYGSALRSMALWLPFIRNKIKEADEEIARLAPPAKVAALSIGEDATDDPAEESVAALPVSTAPTFAFSAMDVDPDAVEVDSDSVAKPNDDEWT